MDAKTFKNSIKIEVPTTKPKANNSCLSIIYAKTGKRIEFTKRIHEMIGNAEKISISFDLKKNLLFVFADENGTTVKMNKNKAVIYNASLVKEIIEKLNLDFKEHSSMSFEKFEAVETKTTRSMVANCS